MTLAPESSASAVVRQVVAESVRRRRIRRAISQVAHLAPAFAGVALAAALAARWLAWPVMVPWIVFGLIFLTGITYVLWARRAPEPTDAMAAGVDADAALGGELRSAHWFASASTPNDWETFHLAAAARRAKAVAWDRVYPPERMSQYRLAVGSLAVAAIAIAVGSIRHVPTPSELAAAKTAEAAAAAAAAPSAAMVIPDDLQKRLDALLAAVERGDMPAGLARAEIGDLKDLVSKLGRDAEAALANAMKRGEAAGKSGTAADAKSLADRALQAARANDDMPEDVKWSLKDLAARLAAADRPSTTGSAATPGTSGSSQPGDSASQTKGNADPNAGDLSVQMMRMADTSASDMLGSAMGTMGGDSRPGGPGRSGRGNAAQAAVLEQALRKETIEAAADTAGTNVTAELRRKTEQGRSSLGFAHVAVPTTFDRSRAVAPPPVPEERRALLQQYFIRRQ